MRSVIATVTALSRAPKLVAGVSTCRIISRSSSTFPYFARNGLARPTVLAPKGMEGHGFSGAAPRGADRPH